MGNGSTRREFVTTSVAGIAGLSISSRLDAALAAQGMPAEDGYKLWLRYAPPGEAATQYRRLVRTLVVQGESLTARVIREEMTSAIGSMLGAPPAVQTA